MFSWFQAYNCFEQEYWGAVKIVYKPISKWFVYENETFFDKFKKNLDCAVLNISQCCQTVLVSKLVPEMVPDLFLDFMNTKKMTVSGKRVVSWKW